MYKLTILLTQNFQTVSFQDGCHSETSNNNNNNNTVKELPMSFRRNSITPLPTRARQSRPNNNGPLSNSLFFKETENQR